LSGLTTSQSGYEYLLQAVNSQGTNTSTPAELTVLVGEPQFVWSAPVVYEEPGVVALTANQILTAPPGQVVGAALFGNTAIEVTNIGGGYSNILFTADGSVAAVTSGGVGDGYGGAFGTNTTGNAGFDAALGGFNPVGNPSEISLYGLTVGQTYSVQLFALDDRPIFGPGSSRPVSFQDPNNASDVSAPFETIANNSYIVGTFCASNTVVTIQENVLAGAANMNALVIREIPTLSIAKSGSELVLTWSGGTLLQTTNLLGPWTPSTNSSPYTFTPTGPRMFYGVGSP
jgi:hypothetical protein